MDLKDSDAIREHASFADEAAQDISIPAPNSPDIPRIDTENLDLLYDMAKKYVATTRIGEFQSYCWPFEVQAGSDFRKLHAPLIPLFNIADEARKKVRQSMVWMRVITFSMYAAYIFSLWSIFRSIDAESGSVSNISAYFAGAGNKIYIAMIFVVPIVAYFFRQKELSALKQQASKFGGEFNANLHLLQSKANFAFANVANDGATAEGCEIRAEKWAFISLWLFQYYQFYDRYVTTASWRAKTSLSVIAAAFIFFKWVLNVVLLIALYFATDWFSLGNVMLSSALVFFVVVVAGQVWDTGLFGGASDNLWADNFVPQVSGRSEEEIVKNHMNTKFAKLVGVLREYQYQAANN